MRRFLAVKQCPGLWVCSALDTYDRLSATAAAAVSLCDAAAVDSVGRASRGAFVPQPESLRSTAHNLSPSEQRFVPVTIQETLASPTLTGEFFESYGAASHSLLYLRGSDNIPSCAIAFREALSSAICNDRDLLSAAAVDERGGGLLPSQWPWLASGAAVSSGGGSAAMQALSSWRTTVNVYKNQDAESRRDVDSGSSGYFPFHKDIAANGTFTAVLSLGSPGVLEFVDQPLPGGDSDTAAGVEWAATDIDGVRVSVGAETTRVAVAMRHGTAALMTGEARWRWLHRAVPGGGAVARSAGLHDTSSANESLHPLGVKRVSVVLGCRP